MQQLTWSCHSIRSTRRIGLWVSMVLLLSFEAANAGWSALAGQSTPPTPRHEGSYVELHDRFYLMGGRGLLAVECYDPGLDQWSSRFVTPIELHHFQAVALDGLIYVVAALTGPFPGELPVESILIYDAADDRWFEGPASPVGRRRGAAGAFVRDGDIYVVGGQESGHLSGTQGWFDVFDPDLGTWQSLPDMPHARDHFQAALQGEALYVVAGRVSNINTGSFSGTVAELDVFDFGTGSWSTMADPLPTLRAGAPTAFIDGFLAVFGGESDTQVAAHAETELYDPASDGWSSSFSMVVARHGTHAIEYGGQLYVAAGSGNRGGGPELSSQECFSLTGNCIQATPVAHRALAAAASAPGLDFGDVSIGDFAQLVIPIVAADAGSEINLTGVRLIGADMHAFELVSVAASTPGSVVVRFNPSAIREFGVGTAAYGSLSNAAIAIDYAEGEGALCIPLRGSGVAATSTLPLRRQPAAIRAFPNPSHGVTRFQIDAPFEGYAELHVYDVKGRRVTSLDVGPLQLGQGILEWDGSDRDGYSLAHGVYLVRLIVDGENLAIRRLTLR